MIKAAYLDVSDLNLSKAYELLPKSRMDKVKKFKFDRDKKLSAGAYLLLNKMLKEEKITEPDFKIGKYGKAYISNHEDFHFNLSHSNKMVLCAISDMEVGFFKYWVLKESYMKYTGLGMNLKLDSFEIMIEDEIRLKNDSKELKFNLFDIKDYKIGIAGHYNVSELIELDISEIYIKRIK